jgi:hypothetical protein
MSEQRNPSISEPNPSVSANILLGNLTEDSNEALKLLLIEDRKQWNLTLDRTLQLYEEQRSVNVRFVNDEMGRNSVLIAQQGILGDQIHNMQKNQSDVAGLLSQIMTKLVIIENSKEIRINPAEIKKSEREIKIKKKTEGKRLNPDISSQIVGDDQLSEKRGN